MTDHEQKVVQYLDEAHASEVALIRVLQSQIAMAPPGSLRTSLERHLDETRDHARRVRARVSELQSAGNPLQAWFGLTEAVIGQVVAFSKTPLDLLRGTSVEERVLKNAKDSCAAEALEIATYTAIERLARQRADDETAELAASILADERRMLDRLLDEIPALTDAVARAEVDREPSSRLTPAVAADAARKAGERVTRAARDAGASRARAGAPARRKTGGSSTGGGNATASEE